MPSEETSAEHKALIPDPYNDESPTPRLRQRKERHRILSVRTGGTTPEVSIASRFRGLQPRPDIEDSQ